MALRVAKPLFCITHLLLISLTTIINSQILPRTQLLTPDIPNLNGATVINHFQEVTNINNTFHVLINSQSSWQFILLLDKTWAFDPFYTSTLHITINSPSIATGPDTFDDLVFGFTTFATNPQYFSIWIPMDNNGQKNRIYPYCNTDTIPTQTFGVGEIASLPDTDRNCDVAGGSCANWRTILPKNAQYPSVFQYNNFPITFILENNPNKNTLKISFISSTFTTSFIQSCGFIAFPTNQGLKMYIGGNDPGQKFIITSFEIEAYVSTDTPTISPTNIPTISPTYQSTNIPSTSPTNPTQNPSKSPTNIPSKSPTYHPTMQPTDFPTTNPTTFPSKTPTNFPSKSPTNEPTNEPTIEPTYFPSKIPTNIPSKSPTNFPSNFPSYPPTKSPLKSPTMYPTNFPTINPSIIPTIQPTQNPITHSPTHEPTIYPSLIPTYKPSELPSITPSKTPSIFPSTSPSHEPSLQPSTNQPSTKPTRQPSITPTAYPTLKPSENPTTARPSMKPTPLPVYMFHPTTETPTLSPTYQPSDVPTNMPVVRLNPTFRPTDEVVSSTMESTRDIVVEDPGGNNQNVEFKPKQFGDIILPVTLVVLVGACALCCVVIVIIRQLCIKSQRVAKKPRKYITAIQVTPTNTDNRAERGPLSDTDSIDAQQIHHVHHVQPRRHHKDASDASIPIGTAGRFESGKLTIPLKKKNTFCRNLQTHAGNNNLMMDDIIEEMDDGYIISPNGKYYSNADTVTVSPNEEHKYSYEQDSADSDDTQMEKPHLHNYSTLTLHSGRVIADQIQHESKQQAYHEITPSGFGRLQHAINSAKTHSDFDRLESLIKNGKIPSPNWHGKGDGYGVYGACNTYRCRGDTIDETREDDYEKSSESSVMKSSESSDTQTQTETQIETEKEMLGNKVVALDENELAVKLVGVKNERKYKRKRRVVRNVKQQYID